MKVIVSVVLQPPGASDPPPPGWRVLVEVRDVSLADAPSVTVASAESVTTAPQAGAVAELELAVDAPPGARLDAWALVRRPDHGREPGPPRALPGDWVTGQSHPVPTGSPVVRVEAGIRRVD